MPNKMRPAFLSLAALFGMVNLALASVVPDGGWQNRGQFTAQYTLNNEALRFRTGPLLSGGAGWLPVPTSPGQFSKQTKLPINGRVIDVEARVISTPRSLAKAILNPWAFAANALFTEGFGRLIDAACVRLAGGHMVNTGGAWEECRQVEQGAWQYKVVQGSINVSAGTVTQVCNLWSQAWVSQNPGYEISLTGVVDNWTRPTNPQPDVDYNPSPPLVCNALFYWRWPNGTIGNPGGTPVGANPSARWSSTMNTVYEPITPDDALTKLESTIANNPAQYFQDLGQQPKLDLEATGQPTISGPTSVPRPANENEVSVTQNPDGTTTTTTTTKVDNYTYNQNSVTHQSTTTNQTTVITNNAGDVISTTTTTIQTAPQTGTGSETVTLPDSEQPPSEQTITCGLPDTPPCKIDETGTPEADPAKTQEEIDSMFGQVKTCLQNIEACLPTLPELSWTFALPSGCSALSFDTQVGHVVSIDMCAHQGVIHDIMSMLWAAAGLFGAVAMVSRFTAGGA